MCFAFNLRGDKTMQAKIINKPSDDMFMINDFDELQSTWGHALIF